MNSSRCRMANEHHSSTGRTLLAGTPTPEPLDDRTTYRATERTHT